jgi:hypothetical protein
MSTEEIVFPTPTHPENMAIDLRIDREGVVLRADGPANAVTAMVVALAGAAGAAAGAWTFRSYMQFRNQLANNSEEA